MVMATAETEVLEELVGAAAAAAAWERTGADAPAPVLGVTKRGAATAVVRPATRRPRLDGAALDMARKMEFRAKLSKLGVVKKRLQ